MAYSQVYKENGELKYKMLPDSRSMASVLADVQAQLQEEKLREALIRLGWLPPPEQALQIDIERYIQQCHIALRRY
jgi:hypothetical protein